MLFREYVLQWKQDCRTNIGESWCDTQDKLIELHIAPLLNETPLDKITPSDISKVLNASKVKGHSPKTTLHIYTILFSLFQNAIEFYECLTKNPVKMKFHRPKVPKKKAAFMTPEMTLIFLEYVMDTRYSVGVWVQALTAMRVGEMLTLKWKDIDFTNDQITISRKYNRKRKEPDEFTKNKEQHYVPMPPMLRRYLEPLRGDPEAFLMPNENGDNICYFVYRRFMRKVCARLKVPIKNSHGLRHSCTELWVNAGATAEDLRRLLNHKSLDATAGYIHRTDDRLKRISKLIA